MAAERNQHRISSVLTRMATAFSTFILAVILSTHYNPLGPNISPGDLASQNSFPIIIAKTEIPTGSRITAEQLQVARAGGVRDHRHGGDRRESEDAIRSMLFYSVGVGRADELGDFIPIGAHQSTAAANGRVRLALLRALDDRRPRSHRRHALARLAPELQEPAAHHRVFHAIAGIEIP